MGVSTRDDDGKRRRTQAGEENHALLLLPGDGPGLEDGLDALLVDVDVIVNEGLAAGLGLVACAGGQQAELDLCIVEGGDPHGVVEGRGRVGRK